MAKKRLLILFIVLFAFPLFTTATEDTIDIDPYSDNPYIDYIFSINNERHEKYLNIIFTRARNEITTLNKIYEKKYEEVLGKDEELEALISYFNDRVESKISLDITNDDESRELIMNGRVLLNEIASVNRLMMRRVGFTEVFKIVITSIGFLSLFILVKAIKSLVEYINTINTEKI